MKKSIGCIFQCEWRNGGIGEKSWRKQLVQTYMRSNPKRHIRTLI